MRLLTTLLLLAVVAMPRDGVAQTTTQDATPSAPLRVSPAFGVHYGTPLRFSLSAGVLIDKGRRHNDGVVALVEAGQHGNEISAGYFRTLGRLGTGYSLRGAVIRTGDEPWNASPRTTYVGAELQYMAIFGVGARVGYFRRASRSMGDFHDNLASLGLSLGA